jgi:Tol biopolymer transport system component
VAFQSIASDLVANDTNEEADDIFVRDLKRGTTTLVSVNGAGTGSGNDASFEHTLSADGQVVAFTSSASDLVANDTNEEVQDVFVRDLKRGTTTLMTINSTGTGSGNGDSLSRLSADGRVVAIESSASDLVANDTNGAVDIFVRPIP